MGAVTATTARGPLSELRQWGVELGKMLAKQVRTQVMTSRTTATAPIAGGFNPATATLLKPYLS